MSASPLTLDANEVEGLLLFVAQAAIDDLQTDVFMVRFQTAAESIAPAMFGTIDDPLARRAAIGQLGRSFWSVMPKPKQGWRLLPTPKPERNGPCPCGSGKKFKQCCQPHEAPADMAPNLNMLKFVLDLWPEPKMSDVPLRRIDPAALADTAHQWQDEGESERAIRLLERLFEKPAHLDERHISCFEELCDGYLNSGMQSERQQFVARISAHGNKYLASAATQRAVTLASDEGDYESAWEAFGRAMRLTPDDPFLAHLEVLVLKSEGRLDEAKARAAMWAARLRRMNRPDYEDLIESLEHIVVAPGRTMLNRAERNRPGDDEWSNLLGEMPGVELLYAIDHDPAPDDTFGFGRIAVAMKPLPALARIEHDWRDRFFVQKPSLIDLYGDPARAREPFADIAQFMRAHPSAWQSFEILDDLVLIARDRFDEDDENDDEDLLILGLTGRALDLLDLCLAGAGEGKALVQWNVLQNRPALRLVAQRIDALLDRMSEKDADEIDHLQAWMLELNPHDNHGYRGSVMQGYLFAEDLPRAIALADRYPEDAGDMAFDHALALFQSGRSDEAAMAWNRGAESTPDIAATLLAKNPKRPAIEAEGGAGNHYEIFGGPTHAWRYRTQMLEIWMASGALAWAKTLPRVPVPKPKKSPPASVGSQPPTLSAGLLPPAQDLDETVLLHALAADSFAVAPLHGLLTAVTLSPRKIMSSQWLGIAMEFRRGQPVSGIDALNATIQPLMGLYNCLNSALRMKRGEGYVPSPVLTTAEPAQATEWARSFMRVVEQGRGAWRDKTSTPEGKAALTTIERVAAGMVASDRLRHESAALALAIPLAHDATWRDVLVAATRVLAAA